MGEIAVLAVGLCPAAKALATRHPSRRPFEGYPAQTQDSPGSELLLLGDDAAGHVERCPRSPLSDPLSAYDGFPLRLHRSRQYIYVRLRSVQVILSYPLRRIEVLSLHRRSSLHHTVQHPDRECRGHLGTLREEA